MHGSMKPELQRNERDGQRGRQHIKPRKQQDCDLKKSHFLADEPSGHENLILLIRVARMPYRNIMDN